MATLAAWVGSLDAAQAQAQAVFSPLAFSFLSMVIEM